MHADARARSMHGALLHLGSQRVATRRGPFCVETFCDLAGRRHVLALTRGDVRNPRPLLARVHVSCTTSECMGGCDCDCVERLDTALAAIAAEDRGVVFYLMHEGRGAGLSVAARTRMVVQASRYRITAAEAYDLMGLHRDLGWGEPVAFARRLLGATAPLRLLSDHGEQAATLEAQGVAIDAVVPVGGCAAALDAHDLVSPVRAREAPRAHGEERPELELPEDVVYFDPYPLPDAPRFLRMASHLVPVRAATGVRPLWFRLHVYLDREADRERAVLTHGGLREPLVRIQRDALLDRFAAPSKRGWPGAARSIAAHGAGCAVFLAPELGGEARALPDEAALALVAHHVKGRCARLVVDAPDAAAMERACSEPLRQRGISLDAPLVLDGTP